jgi:protein-disulfide isomerase
MIRKRMGAMTYASKAFWTAVVLLASLSSAYADDDARMSERYLGKPNAPVKVDEFVSLTCSHCADFYSNILPELEKRYVDTGKVRIIMHDFPLDGISLKAAAVARCMPADEYFPFVKTLYKTQMAWAFGPGNPEANMIRYASLGGLPEDKAKACANDAKLQEAIIAERTAAAKYNVESTPTFIINDGAETIGGAQSVETFAAAFDRQLAAKK